jgi:hypothetical protein
MYVTIISKRRVYFRISLKRGQTHGSKLQGAEGGGKYKSKGGNPILNIFSRGGEPLAPLK